MTENLTPKLPTVLTTNAVVPLTDRQRWQLALLAFVGALQPTPLPLTFLHKLHLKQYGWSAVYFILGLTQVARVACAIEGVWYLFGAPLPALSTRLATAPAPTLPDRAAAIRALEQLRQDGLLSEYEFEQQRRQVLELP